MRGSFLLSVVYVDPCGELEGVIVVKVKDETTKFLLFLLIFRSPRVLVIFK
jgi:hypothetical protein